MEGKKNFFSKALFNTRVKSANVKPIEILLGYFIGPFGALLSSGIFAALLNVYFVETLFGDQMTDYIETFLFLLPLLSIVLIAVGNLVIGQLLERTKTMQGKARPWILLSAVLISSASVFMFIVPFSNPVGKMIWLTIGYNLFYAVAFPIYSTANSTMVPLSTRNSKQRGLLASASNISGLAVMGAGTMIFPIIASNLLGNNQVSWFVALLAVGIFAGLACLLQFYFTRERVSEEAIKQNIQAEVKPSMKKQLKAVAGDKKWWFVMLFWLFFQIGGMLQNVAMPFFSRWAIDPIGGDWGLTMAILGIIGAIPMAIAVVLVWPLSNKIGKKNLTVIGLIIGTVGGVIAGIGAALAVPNIYVVAVGIAFQMLGAAPAAYLILAMLSDQLDHMEAKNGFRCDGFTMSMFSLIGAVTAGIGMAVLNGMLGAAGFVSGLGDEYAGIYYQPEAVRTLISVGYIWVRTVAFAVGAVLLLFFIVEKTLKEDQKIILERQKAEVLSKGEEWIEPQERLRLEQEEYDRLAEEARKEELRMRCEKKGVSFEQAEANYQAKLAAKEAKKTAKNPSLEPIEEELKEKEETEQEKSSLQKQENVDNG